MAILAPGRRQGILLKESEQALSRAGREADLGKGKNQSDCCWAAFLRACHPGLSMR